MDKSKKEQAEKLQTKLDKLLQSKEKKQQSVEKSKQELNAISKEIDGTKLKLFEILQNGFGDTGFSNWVKRKINETTKDTSLQNQQTQPNQNNKF